MDMFDNNAKDFIDKIQNMNAASIIALTQEVEKLIKTASESEKVFAEASANGIALTKRQRNEYKSFTDDIKSTAEAQKALTKVIQDTWEASKNAPKGSAEKKELTDKMALYRKLEGQVKEYQKAALSASEAGYDVRNKKAASKVVNIDVDDKKNEEARKLTEAQKKAQLESLRKSASEVRDQTRNAVSENIKGNQSAQSDEDARAKLGQEMRKADVRWISQTKFEAEDLKNTLKNLYDEKKNMESSKPLKLFSDDEIKEYAQILADINAISEKLYGKYEGGMSLSPDGAKKDEKKVKQEAKEKEKSASGEEKKMPKVDMPKAEPSSQKIIGYKLNAELKPEPQKPNAGQTRPAKELIKGSGINGSVESYKSLEEEIERVRREHDALASEIKASGMNGTEYLASVRELQKYEEELKKLEAVKKSIDSEKEEPFKADPKTYSELTAYIDVLREHIGKLSQDMQEGKSSNFEEDAKQLKEYIDELKRLEGIQKNIDNARTANEEPEKHDYKYYKKRKKALPKEIKQAGFAIKGSDDVDGAIKKFQELKKEQENVNKTLEQAKTNSYGAVLKKSFSDLGKVLGSAVVNGVKVASNAILSLDKQIAMLGINASKMIGQAALKGFQALANGAMAGARALQHLAVAGFEMLKSYGQKALSGIGTLASKEFGALSAGARLAFGGVKAIAVGGFGLLKQGAQKAAEGVHDLINKFKNLGGKTSKKTLKGLMSIKSMLMRRIKRTFISAIFNQAKEGMQQLAKYDEAFNESMSAIKNASKQAAGNLSATLGNIVNLIAPALTTVLNLLSSLFEKINGIFALLNGKSSVGVATKSTDDYAKTLKKAGGAAKDLNHQLYGFDEITKQQDDNSKNTGSLIGYEEKDVGEVLGGIQDTFKEIINAFKKGDFEKVGKLAGKMIANVIDSIDKKVIELQKKAPKWSENIARILNGLVDSGVFKNAGKLVGDGVNLIIDTVRSFLSTFNFGNLGKAFADGINTIFSTVNFNIVGDTIARGFNAVWDTIDGFLSNFDWDKFGDKFANGLNALIYRIDFNKKASAITNGVNGLVTSLSKILNNVRWGDYVKKFTDSLNNLVSGIHWDELGSLLGDGINVLFGSINKFFDTFKFDELGSKLAEGFSSLIDKVDFAEVGKSFTNVFNSINQTIASFVAGIDFTELGEKVASGIQSMFDNVDWEASQNAVVGGINGIIEGATALLTNVDFAGYASKLGEHFNNIINGINWADLGNLVGLGINTVFSSLNSFFDSFDFANLGEKLGLGLTNVINTVNFDEIGKNLSNLVNGVWQTLSGFLSKIDYKTLGTKIGSGIQSMFSNIDWESKKKAITTGVNGVVTALSNAIKNVDWKGFAKDFADNVNGIIKGINWTEMGKMFGEGFNAVLGALSTLLTEFDWANLGTQIATGLQTFISTVNWEEVQKTVSGFVNGITDAFLNFVTGVNWTQLAKDIMTSLNTLVTTGINWEKISTLLSTSINALIDIFGTLVTSDTIVNLATNLGKTAGDFLKNIDWTKLATDIGLGIGQLAKAFANLVTEMDAPGIAKKIAEGINALFDPEKGGAGFATAVKAVGEGVNSLIKGFAALVGEDGINFTGIAETLASSINGLVKDTDWATLISTIGRLSIDLGTAISKAITDIKWTDVATQLVNSINALFSDENKDKLKTLGTSISNALKSLLEGVGTLVANIDISKIVSGLTSWISGFDFTGVIKKAFELMVDAIPNLIGQIPNLISNLVSFVGSIDWLGIAKAIIKGIGDVLVSAAKAVVSLVTNLVDMVKSIDWLEVGKAIITGIGDILVSAVNAVGGFLSTIFHAIFGGGEEQKVEVPQVLSDEVIAKLKAQMTETGKMMADTLTNSIITNLDAAGSDYDAARKHFLNSASLIAKEGTERLDLELRKSGISEEALAQLHANVKKVLDACTADDADLETIKEAFKENGIWITDGLAEALKGESLQNISQAMALLAEGVDSDTIAMMDMTHLNENLEKYMAESGKTLEQVAKELGSDVGEGIGTQIPDAIKKALKIGEKEVEQTAGQVAQAADTSKNQVEAGKNAEATGKEIKENLTEELKDTDDIATASEGVATSIDDKLKTLPEDEKKQAEEMMKYLIDGIKEGNPLVTTAIENAAKEIVKKAEEILTKEKGTEIAKALIQGMKDAFEADITVKGTSGQSAKFAKEVLKDFSDTLTNEAGKTIGSEYIKGLSKGMSDENRSTLKPEVRDVTSDVIDTLKDGINRSNGYDISYYIMQGLADGLSGNRRAVVSWAETVAEDLVNTMKDKLGIASPSKVFAEIGKFTMQGINVGMEGQEKSVLNTVSGIAKAIADEGSDIELASNMDVMTSGLDNVANKMADLAQIFSDIASTIQDMGGLEIPTVASGKVLPYRTKVEDMRGTESPVLDSNELESALYNAFSRAMSSPDNEQPINITLQIDGRKLSDIVTRYQRQQSRAWSV